MDPDDPKPKPLTVGSVVFSSRTMASGAMCGPSGQPDWMTKLVLASPPTGWQAIETAPKDGTHMLLAIYHSGVGWHIAEGGWSVKREGFWMWGLNYYDPMPTHWMPLPDPPFSTAPNGTQV